MKLKTIALFFLLLQSCHIYKPVSINEIEKGKNYKITLKSGQEIEEECLNVNEHSISMAINKKVLEIPKSKIDKAKKEKLSVLTIITIVSVASLGIIVLFIDTKPKSESVEITPPEF